MTKTQKRIYDLTHAARNGWDIAAEIAAEIDDLTERNAFLLTSAATAQAKLAEARAEVERMRPVVEAALYKQACAAWDAGTITPFEFAEAHKLYSPQARRAREAAKAVQP